MPIIIHFKMVSFMSCGFYPNKLFLKIAKKKKKAAQLERDIGDETRAVAGGSRGEDGVGGSHRPGIKVEWVAVCQTGQHPGFWTKSARVQSCVALNRLLNPFLCQFPHL